MQLTTIPVTPEVRDRLKRLASEGETYDRPLRRLVRDAEAGLLYEREKRILETEELVGHTVNQAPRRGGRCVRATRRSSAAG